MKEIILEAGRNGKIFTVVFIKRTTGEKRIMTCRLGVSKYVNGVGMAYNPEEHNLIGVYDMQYAAHGNPAKAYRMISLNSILEIRGNGRILWTKVD